MVAEKLREFEKRVKNRVSIALAGAFALVIALSWNEAIKEVVSDIIGYLNIVGPTYYYKIIAAIITTIIGVLGIMYFSKWSEDGKK